jgi:predicted SAM-dependent methyltransferase
VQRLNLGCGSDIMPDYVNVDMVQTGKVDVVHDLDVGPWPFEDGSCHKIVAWDVFEHVADPLLFMNESWRVLERGGMLHLRTPHFTSEHAFTDPTHRRFPTKHTWDYWIPGTLLHKEHHAAYGPATFERIQVLVDPGGTIHVALQKVIR